jgi:hypothetical protein
LCKFLSLVYGEIGALPELLCCLQMTLTATALATCRMITPYRGRLTQME